MAENERFELDDIIDELTNRVEDKLIKWLMFEYMFGKI